MKKLLSLLLGCAFITCACNNETPTQQVNAKGNGDTAAGGTPMSVMDSTTKVLSADSL